VPGSAALPDKPYNGGMSETVLKIFLKELQTLRIVCTCGTAMDIPIAKLARQDDKRPRPNAHCPCCNAMLRRGGGGTEHKPTDDIFDEFGALWMKLNALSDAPNKTFDVQLIMTDKPAPHHNTDCRSVPILPILS